MTSLKDMKNGDHEYLKSELHKLAFNPFLRSEWRVHFRKLYHAAVNSELTFQHTIRQLEETHLDFGDLPLDEEWIADLPEDNLPGVYRDEDEA